MLLSDARRQENQSNRLIIPYHTKRNQKRPRRRRAPGHPDCRRTCPLPTQTLSFRILVMLRAGFWLGSKFYSIGARMSSDEGQPRPASPRPTRRARRGGRCPLPSLRPPGVCPRETPARFHRGPGTAGRHAGRAGRPAAESLAASPRRSRRACGHCPAPGEPRTARSATVTGSRVGARSARGVRSGRARRPSGKSRLPSSWPARGIHLRAFRDRLAKASSAAPGHGGAPQA